MKHWNFNRKKRVKVLTLTDEEISALKAVADEYKYHGHRDSTEMILDTALEGMIYCPKDDILVNIEKCFDCGYNTGEDEVICKFGEVPLEKIQAEQILKHNLDIAIDNKWREG